MTIVRTRSLDPAELRAKTASLKLQIAAARTHAVAVCADAAATLQRVRRASYRRFRLSGNASQDVWTGPATPGLLRTGSPLLTNSDARGTKPCNHFSVADPRDRARDLERGRDRAPSPPNLIRETSQFDYPDPPNLQRLSTRQVIEERGVAEIQERFVGEGIVAHDDEGNPPSQ